MHKLNREQIEEPQCLADYDYRLHNWNDDFGTPCKKQLKKALYLLQGNPELENDKLLQSVRCAYCENLVNGKSHIEHFRRKHNNHFPELTFSWNNLFISCEETTHCGHFKDRPKAPPYNANNLIKPDESDPDTFLYFHSNGFVRPRREISAVEHQIAHTTIEVFNLNEGTLVGSRKKAIDRFLKPILADLDEIENWPDINKTAFFSDELAQTYWRPFATAIRHSLT